MSYAQLLAMAYRVFVSYSSHDRTIAAQVQQWLMSAGAEVFVADYSLPAGADLRQDILRQIRACDLFVLLWSQHAKDSGWVQQEVGAAQGQGKPTIPVVLDGTPVPGFLQGLKYLPAFDDLEGAMRWLQQHVANRAKTKSTTSTVLGLAGALLLVMSLGQGGQESG